MNNRSAVKRMVKIAQAHEDLDDLVYYVEMELPMSMRPRPDAAEMPVTFPPGWIPVIPLTEDPKIAEHWAHMLLELSRAANSRRNILFRTALTSRSYMGELGLLRVDGMLL